MQLTKKKNLGFTTNYNVHEGGCSSLNPNEWNLPEESSELNKSKYENVAEHSSSKVLILHFSFMQ